MERRTLLKASLASLVLPSTNGQEAGVQRKRTDDTGRLSIRSVTLAGMQLDAEGDDLPTMYNPQLVATIEGVDSMVIRREINDPDCDFPEGFPQLTG